MKLKAIHSQRLLTLLLMALRGQGNWFLSYYLILSSYFPVSLSSRPQQIIIFIVGGATYEEAACVAGMNRNSVNVLLGGTHMLNTTRYLLKKKITPLVSILGMITYFVVILMP